MDFDAVKASGHGVACGVAKVLDHAADAGQVQGRRRADLHLGRLTVGVVGEYLGIGCRYRHRRDRCIAVRL
ncbi:hypothetical protein D3C72_1855120 [compost metagenome]